MIARLSMIWNAIWNSLWALPTAFVIAAAAFAIGAVHLKITSGGSPAWWLYSGDAKAASGFLANLLTAMITMATLAISITMVVLTLAAQSLGPRLIPIFMGDTRTKVALGIFIGTVVYLLIALRTVVGDADTVPNLAITLGTALVLVSVIVLPYFVHHLARSIVADTIIKRVGDALDTAVDRLLPANEGGRQEPDFDRDAIERDGRPILATFAGYIQAIDHRSAVAIATKADVTVVFRGRPGHFFLAGDILAWAAPAKSLDDDSATALINAVVTGSDRTPVQDLEFSIRQLVEIALRALSPGVNDPFTAAAVIDRLTGSIAKIMNRGPARSVWCDTDRAVRVFVPTSRFAGILDAAFNQIRQAGAAQPAILIRLVDRLGQLRDHADTNETAAIVRHIDLTLASGLTGFADEADRRALSERVSGLLERTA